MRTFAFRNNMLFVAAVAAVTLFFSANVAVATDLNNHEISPPAGVMAAAISSPRKGQRAGGDHILRKQWVRAHNTETRTLKKQKSSKSSSSNEDTEEEEASSTGSSESCRYGWFGYSNEDPTVGCIGCGDDEASAKNDLSSQRCTVLSYEASKLGDWTNGCRGVVWSPGRAYQMAKCSSPSDLDTLKQKCPSCLEDARMYACLLNGDMVQLIVNGK